MAARFTDLLREINARAALKIGITAASGFVEGLGLPPLPVPSFQTQARSMAWLLDNARKVRAATLEAASAKARGKDDTHIDPKTIDPRELLHQAGEPGVNEEGDAIARVKRGTQRAGDMLMYIYDPKTKDRLPYYDTFPLVFPINIKPDGWLGLNMHYLPPTARAVLMDSLYITLNNTMMNETTRLTVNYEMLKGASLMKNYKPAIKRYLFNHVRSEVMVVNPEQWDAVLMLPTARFVKADQLRVWGDSLDMIRGIKKKNRTTSTNA